MSRRYLIPRWRSLRRLDRGGWLAAFGVAWGGSALATLAFTTAFEYGNPDVVVLLQKTQPLWAIAAAAVVMRERPLRALGWFLAPALVGTYLLSFGTMAPADAFTGAQGRAARSRSWPRRSGAPPPRSAGGRCVALEPSIVTAVRFTLALPLLAVIALYEGAVRAAAAAHASRLAAAGRARADSRPGRARALLPRPRAHAGIGGDVRRAGLPGDGARS